MIYVNREDIEVLLRNIIDNAIKFTEKGSVEMTAHMDNESVVVTVIDTGCGIASKDKDKIFDKFYKRHVAVPGTGLGLAICKEIVKKYGGTIDVISEGVNKGTTVTFILPKGGQ